MQLRVLIKSEDGPAEPVHVVHIVWADLAV